MAVEIREKFEVAAPVESVWRFVMDPTLVAPCLPGAVLDEVIDERNFLGGVKIKIGAITTQYKGKVELTKVDEAARRVEMQAEGRESSGGSAKALIVSTLLPTAGGTEVTVEATADITGKVMQVGSRMIEGVSKQLFQQFAKRLRAKLEGQQPAPVVSTSESSSPMADQAPAQAAPVQAPQPVAAKDPRDEDEALSIVPLILRAIWDSIVGFFRALFGRAR